MNLIFIYLAIILLVAVDQGTKIWAVHALANGHEIQLIEGVFHFHFLKNTGAAWGILSGKQIFLIGLTSVIIIAMLIYLWKMPVSPLRKWYRVAFVLIISGAIGNLIDRIAFHYVRDFLYFKLIEFPIFNVADIFVVCGVILLMLIILFLDKSDQEKEE